ncbi:MAG TPA: hypothetical protein VHO03_03620 [Ignavibacteriales bacterium]|nr:hypothetical protein [Ignavibacteriales bacterium]
MIKLRFKDYPNGAWEDWSDFLITPPQISKRVEADKAGVAGAVVYDDAGLVLWKESGNPVYTAFNKDLTAVQRYLFEIYCPNSKGQQRKLFEGMADFGSNDEPELSNTLSLTVKDKLSAMALLEIENARTYQEGVTPAGSTHAVEYSFIAGSGVTYLDIRFKASEGSYTAISTSESLWPLNRGMVWVHPVDNTKHLILSSKIINLGAGNNQLECVLYPAVKSTSTIVKYDNEVQMKKYSAAVYSQDIGVYAMSTLYYGSAPTLTLLRYDGIKFISALLKKQWPDSAVVNRTGSAEFPVPLEYFEQLIFDQPFNTDPYGALKLLAGSMQCYMYFDNDSNLVLQSKKNIGTNGTTRSLGTTAKIDASGKYFWDKIADGVSINVKSWVMQNGETITGKAQLGKTKPGSTAPIKPKNGISRDVLATDSSINTQDALNAYALQVAEDDMNFYGLRHGLKRAKLDLDDNILGVDEDPTSGWDILDNIVIDGASYFWPRMSYDLVKKTLDVDFVGVQGHEYVPGQVSVPYGDNSAPSGSSPSGGSSSGGGSGTSYDTRYWSGSAVGLDALLGRQSLGLDNIANLGTGAVSTAEFNYLAGLTGNIQGQLNTLNADRHSHGNIAELNSIDQNLSKLNSVEFAGLTANGDNNGIFAGQDLGFAKKAGAIAQLVAGSGKDFIFSKLGNAVVNAANLAAGTLTELMRLTTAGALIVLGSITSNAAQGTAPFVVSSTTQVNNLNAELWNGHKFSDFLNQAVRTDSSPTFVNLTTGPIGIGNSNEIWGRQSSGLYLNYRNYAGDTSTAFSDFSIYNGKAAAIVTFTGSTKVSKFYGDIDASATLYFRNNIKTINKAGTAWLDVFARNTSGTEALIDLSNIGTISAVSTTLSGNIVANGSGDNAFLSQVSIGQTTTSIGKLYISGSSSGYVDAGIVLRSYNAANNYRGLGTYYYLNTSGTEWYIGSPYTDADTMIIARQTGLAAHNDSTAQKSNALITILSNGYMGLGTSPLAKLHIFGLAHSLPASSGTSQTGHAARFQNNDSGGVLDIGLNATSGAWLQVTNGSNLASVYPLLLNPNGGNVSIGSSVTDYKFNVHMASTGNNTMAIFNNADYTSTNRSAIRVRQAISTTSGYSAFLGVDASTHNLFISQDDIAANHLVITPTGNIGIGAPPLNILHIQKNDAGSHNNRPIFIIENTATGGGYDKRTEIQFTGKDSTDTVRTASIASYAGYLQFSTANNLSANFVLGTGNFYTTQNGIAPFISYGAGAVVNTLILNQGKVAVGFATTDEKLNVNGNAKYWGDIYSDNWNAVDPYLGYYIGRSGSVFSKITATEMHVKSFISDLEFALAGSQIVCKSSTKVYQAFSVGQNLIVEEFEGFTGRVFEDGDFVRLRNQSRTNGGIDVVDIWGTVTYLSRDDANKTQTYAFTKTAGSGTSVLKGSTALDYGVAGNGIYEIVAQGPLGKTPFSQIATFATNPWTDLKIRSRSGDLTGVPTTTYGALKNFGVYTQDFYGEGNVNIVGTLTAGDSNGWGNTFYVGKIKKNLISNSSLKAADFSKEAIWTSNSTSTDVTAPDGSNTTVKASTGTTGNRYYFTMVPAGILGANKTYTLSVWAKVSSGQHLANLCLQDRTNGDYGTQIGCALSTTWQRFSITKKFGNLTPDGNTLMGFVNPDVNMTIYTWGWQLEEGSVVTPYQSTDNGTPYGNGYGMWSIAGGFGGTIQNPAISLSDYGLIVRKQGYTPGWRNAGTVSIGWYGDTEWGIKGRDTSGNATFDLGDTNQIAGWAFNNVQFTGGLLVMHKDGKIYAGKGSADDVTSTGFYFDRDNIFFGTQYMTSYIKWNSTTGMNIKTALFTLASSNVSIADTSGWFGANNILTYSANQVTLANWIATTDYLYSGNPSYGVLTLKGGAQPCIELWKDELNNISMWYNSDADWGITGNVEMSELFHLGSGTNHIADWNIAYQKLYCNLFELNAGGNAYINIGDSGNGINVTTIGRYLYGGNGIGWHTVNSGIAATDSNADLIFELSSARRVISGFGFDKTKFYKDIDANNGVRLEASWNGSTGFSGLAVKKNGYDSLMVGDFAMPNLAYSPTDFTSTCIVNQSFESALSTGWTTSISTGSVSRVTSGGIGTPVTPQEGSYFFRTTAESAGSGFAYNFYAQQDLSSPASLLGKHVVVSVQYNTINWSYGGSDAATDYPYLMLELINQNGTIAYKNIFTGSGSGWRALTLDALIPSDSTYVRLKISGGSDTSTHYAYWYDIALDNVKISVYDKSYSYITPGSFNFYSGPMNFFKMDPTGRMSMGLSSLTVNGDNVSAYRGEFTGGSTPANPKAGNWYTSGNYVYLYNGTSWLRLVTA